jgi:pimeloyl-ACP methyl ester carboxylesterase
MSTSATAATAEPAAELTAGTTRVIQHARVKLALHVLRTVEGGPMLLLLHGLGRSAERAIPSDAAAWPGSVCSLDFTGHGESGIPPGGGYTCEILMGDADAALGEIGPATIVGRGLGGYIALLISGARPSLVRGVVIADGPGLAGGGVRPGSLHIDVPNTAAVAGHATPDPFALLELSTDVRPRDYAANFVRSAVQLSPLDAPITVAAASRPPWLQAVIEAYGVRMSSVADALRLYSR